MSYGRTYDATPGMAVRATQPWVERAARIGYLAKGVVYLIVGGLAAAAAFGAGGRTTDSEGALATILHQPFGRVLLALVAIGLAGYVVWRAVEGIADPEGHGTDAKGLVMRGRALVSAVIHASLVVSAVALLTGNGGGSGGGAQGRTAELMSQPFGRWLVGLVGVVVIGAAIQQWISAYSAKFRRRMDYSRVSHDTERWLVRLGRSGLAARGVVFAIIGGFLVVAAWRADPEQAAGLAEVLHTLESQPFGPWLLGLVAIGLALYGADQVAKARLRRIG